MNRRMVAYEVNQFYKTLGTECPKYKNIKVTTKDLDDEFILSEILYDVEDDVYVYEGANELSNKLRHINKSHKIAKAIGIAFILIGFIFMLGTAGASDLGNISLIQTIVQAAISLGVVALGLVVISKTEE